MMVYLDANVVIYFVENRPDWGAKVSVRLGAIHAAGDSLAVSDLTRMECQVGPLKSGNLSLLADFRAFFSLPTVQVLSLPPLAFDRAAQARAAHNLRAVDALHLATSVERGCGLFLTADARLKRFPDIAVEVLT